ncbi:MAG: PASTA domain-containing protein, partial [Micrococcales bacterium]|nr:PASTA domain-containing protein [Micrococcales bacterium]
VSATSLSTGPAGIVLSQDPLPQTRVQAGAAIGVVLSQAAAVIPSVVGKDLESATDILKRLGLVVTATSRVIGTRDEAVISQDPAAGTLAAVGSLVRLVYTLPRIIRPPGRLGLPDDRFGDIGNGSLLDRPFRRPLTGDDPLDGPLR